MTSAKSRVDETDEERLVREAKESPQRVAKANAKIQDILKRNVGAPTRSASVEERNRFEVTKAMRSDAAFRELREQRRVAGWRKL